MSVAILINCTPKYNNRRAVVSGRLRKRQHKKRTLGSGSGCVWLLNVCLIHFEYIHSSFFRLLFHPSDRSFFVVVWFKSSTRVKDLSERTNRRQVSWCASSIYTYSRCDDYDDVSVCVCMITSSKKIKKKLYLQHWSTSHQTTDREHFFSHLYCRFGYIQSSNVLIIITSRKRIRRGKPQSDGKLLSVCSV